MTIITLSIQFSYLINQLFSRQLLTLCKCGIDTMVPVEHAKWMTLTWGYTLEHSFVLSLMTNYGLLWCPRMFTEELLWTVFDYVVVATSYPPAPLRLSTLLAMQAQNWCTPPKNDQKWLKIKQETNSELNIKFNKIKLA